jgi:hypothetical protein
MINYPLREVTELWLGWLRMKDSEDRKKDREA